MRAVATTGKVVITLPNGRSLASRLSDRLRGAPPTALVLFPIVSVQLGAAVAKSLFDSLGPGGTVFLRIAFAAFVLFLLVRPKLGGYDRAGYLVAGLFGLALAGMNFSIYLAFDRIPLGVAVTLEFVGPLGVAVAGSRRVLDLLWVVLAAAGILLLAPLGVLGGWTSILWVWLSRCWPDACGPATSSSPPARGALSRAGRGL